jgi:hypothetical protein
MACEQGIRVFYHVDDLIAYFEARQRDDWCRLMATKNPVSLEKPGFSGTTLVKTMRLTQPQLRHQDEAITARFLRKR